MILFGKIVHKGEAYRNMPCIIPVNIITIAIVMKENSLPPLLMMKSVVNQVLWPVGAVNL